MQKEIKKRAQLYGSVAVLLAIVLGTLCYVGVYSPTLPSPSPPSSGPLKTFDSYEDLRSFLLANSQTHGAYAFLGPTDARNLAEQGINVYETPEVQFSTTNIQVAGVDEADTVKTDGDYLYVLSNNNVSILKAYPPEEAELVSKIAFTDTYPVGIFVSGNRLVVLACKYEVFSLYWYNPYRIDIKTTAFIYDISNKESPISLTNFTMSGSYFNSRMIGDYVYFILSQPAYVIYDTVILPKIYSGEGIHEINASEIQYSDGSDNYYMFTTIVAMNVQNVNEEPTHKTILMGGTSTMYVSLDNIYITFPELGSQTTIYRIRIQNNTLNCEAKGTVSGQVFNQFSMDEYDNYFRVATMTWLNGTRQSNVYILNMNLSVVGSLENIAPGENMDSARFIGKRCYLSTSVQRVDPFFVIDMENATAPKILGNLKIPGFTSYLHPYDEDYIIGIGINGSNIKISLFDVTNVSAPIEMANYAFKDLWSSTTVLTEHKAFLFDKAKELLVIPMTRTLDYYTYTWQGVCVFRINLDGIVLRGGITHEDGNSYWNTHYWVERALYIEDVLYTVSDLKVKLNSLEDLSLLKEIALN